MQRRRHTPEQVTPSCARPSGCVAEGKTTAEAAKALEVSEQTRHRWRNQHGR